MTPFIIVAIIAVVLLAAVALLGAARRRDTGAAVGSLANETLKLDRQARKEAAASAEQAATGKEVERSAVLARADKGEVAPVSKAPATWTPPDPETYGVTRRQFMNRTVFALMGLGISVFGVAIIGFLWPSGASGFGAKIRIGKISDVLADVQSNDGFLYKPEGRMWITEYPAAALAKAEQVYSPSELSGMKVGLVALYQKCPHLGCRVPECASSQWFECPCHGSQYNQVGEKKGGPAPRGMDRFAVEIAGDAFIVNTGQIIQGPAIGVNTTGQEAEGPHCIGADSGGH